MDKFQKFQLSDKYLIFSKNVLGVHPTYSLVYQFQKLHNINYNNTAKDRSGTPCNKSVPAGRPAVSACRRPASAHADCRRIIKCLICEWSSGKAPDLGKTVQGCIPWERRRKSLRAGDPGFDPLERLLLLLLFPGPRLVWGPVFGCRISVVADSGNCD